MEDAGAEGYSELNPNPYLINVRNGLYNVLDETLSEHTAKYLSTVQLNVRYMSDAKCPRFLQFLHESVEEDQVTLIQEMLGYFSFRSIMPRSALSLWEKAVPGSLCCCGY